MVTTARFHLHNTIYQTTCIHKTSVDSTDNTTTGQEAGNLLSLINSFVTVVHNRHAILPDKPKNCLVVMTKDNKMTQKLTASNRLRVHLGTWLI